MLRLVSRRLSPSSVIACVALFVALGGGAYAAATIDSADIANNTVSGKDIKNRSITAKDLNAKTVKSLRGKRGAPGPQGPQGATGAQGPQGVQGPAGTALAYAQVSPGIPSLVAQRTSGITTISRPSTGLYCLEAAPNVVAQAFNGSGDPIRPTVASVEFGNSGAPQTDVLIVQVRGATINCPDNTFEVRTYRNAALADNVAFTLLVP